MLANITSTAVLAAIMVVGLVAALVAVVLFPVYLVLRVRLFGRRLRAALGPDPRDHDRL